MLIFFVIENLHLEGISVITNRKLGYPELQGNFLHLSSQNAWLTILMDDAHHSFHLYTKIICLDIFWSSIKGSTICLLLHSTLRKCMVDAPNGIPHCLYFCMKIIL